MAKRSVWTTVTPFSKYLSLILFVALPFVGFWLGAQYASVDQVAIEPTVRTQIDELYSKDGQYVYFKNSIVHRVDPDTVEVLDRFRLADKNGVYQVEFATEGGSVRTTPILEMKFSGDQCERAGGEVFNTLGQTYDIKQVLGTVTGMNCHCVCLVQSDDDKQVSPAEENTIRECEDIQYEDSVDSCYFQYAISRKDISLCNRIKNTDELSSCLTHLTPEEQEVELSTLGSHPDALRVGEQANVTFTISYAGTEEQATITLYQVNNTGERVTTLGTLADDGDSEDLSPGDYVYSGTFAVGPYEVEQTLQYSAELRWNNEELQSISSDPYKLYITSLPLEHSGGDIITVVDPESGETIAAGQVLVSISDTTSSDRAREIAASVEGEVIDTLYLPPSMVLVVQIPGMEAADVYNAIAVLEMFDEVEYAEPNGVTTLDIPF